MSLCDNLINHFNKSVTQILDDIAPFKTKKISGKSKAPWINKDQLKSLKRTCCKSERKWRKSKLQTDYFNYKELLRKYNTEVKHSRQSYFSQLIAENLNNSKLLFSTIDKLVNPPRPIPAELHSSEKCSLPLTLNLRLPTLGSILQLPVVVHAAPFPYHSPIIQTLSLTSGKYKVMICTKL